MRVFIDFNRFIASAGGGGGVRGAAGFGGSGGFTTAAAGDVMASCFAFIIFIRCIGVSGAGESELGGDGAGDGAGTPAGGAPGSGSMWGCEGVGASDEGVSDCV